MINREAALLAATGELQQQQLQWTRELISIPTVNPYSGDTSAGLETAGQEWFAAQCRHLGGKVRIIPVPEDVYARANIIGPPGRRWQGRPNVVAEWQFGTGAGPVVILNTHMDTVGTDGMTIPPFEPRVEDGFIYGRGSTDSKGNLIVGLTAVAALLKHAGTLNGRVILESVVDEECNGIGAGTLACCLEGITGDFAICLDGSAGSIHNGCNGIATPRITVHGRSGHSSLSGSVNAIDKGFAVKQAIDQFAAALRAEHPDCVFNLGMFHAGALPSIVPSTAELQMNINYPCAEARLSAAAGKGWNGALLRRRFEDMLAGLGGQDPWFLEKPVTVDWLKDAPPFLSPADDEMSRLAIRTVREVAGTEVPVRPMLAWFDASHLSSVLGIPVLGVGSGTLGMSHTAGESARLDNLYRGTRSIALTLYRLFSV